MQGEKVPFMLEPSASDFDIRLPELTTPHQKEKIHPPREGDGAYVESKRLRTESESPTMYCRSLKCDWVKVECAH